jgi:hypothetical protein
LVLLEGLVEATEAFNDGEDEGEGLARAGAGVDGDILVAGKEGECGFLNGGGSFKTVSV